MFQDKSARVGYVRVCHHCTIHEVTTCTDGHNLREDMRRLEDNQTERGQTMSMEELWKKMNDGSRSFVYGGRVFNREGTSRLNEGSIVRMVDKMKGGGKKKGREQEGMVTAGKAHLERTI